MKPSSCNSHLESLILILAKCEAIVIIFGAKGLRNSKELSEICDGGLLRKHEMRKLRSSRRVYIYIYIYMYIYIYICIYICIICRWLPSTPEQHSCRLPSAAGFHLLQLSVCCRLPCVANNKHIFYLQPAADELRCIVISIAFLSLPWPMTQARPSSGAYAHSSWDGPLWKQMGILWKPMEAYTKARACLGMLFIRRESRVWNLAVQGSRGS